MESVKIKVGNDIQIVNKIGFYIFIIGILMFLLTGGILFLGKSLPFEVAIIYFIEVVSQNVYYSFLASILTIIIGFKLADLKNYIETELKIDDDKLMWVNNGETIELPKKKIYKFYWRKKPFSNNIKLTLKTIGIKKYETIIDVMNYSRLKDHLSSSIFEYKRFG
jgi:hypothetical protein